MIIIIIMMMMIIIVTPRVSAHAPPVPSAVPDVDSAPKQSQHPYNSRKPCNHKNRAQTQRYVVRNRFGARIRGPDADSAPAPPNR